MFLQLEHKTRVSSSCNYGRSVLFLPENIYSLGVFSKTVKGEEVYLQS